MNVGRIAAAAAICVILLLIFLYFSGWYKERFYNTQQKAARGKPILVLHKRGGISGINRRIEIYADKSYVVYEKNTILTQGFVDDDTWKSVQLLVGYKNYSPGSTIQSRSEDPSVGTKDQYYYKLFIHNAKIDLGELDEQYTARDILLAIKVIEILML